MSDRAPQAANPSRNPFAEELPPVAERLHSAADPLNPYAAPVGVAEYEPQYGPGPGVWRSNDLIVIHQSLDLPARCIWTNEPTEHRFTLNFAFSTLLGLRSWSIAFDYSFSLAALRRTMKTGLLGGALAAASLVVIATLVSLDQTGIADLTWLAPVFMISLIMGGGLVWKQMQSPLSLIYHEQGYFCLRGAKEPFLRSLPNWPGLHR